jgi:hypothetical protein
MQKQTLLSGALAMAATLSPFALTSSHAQTIDPPPVATARSVVLARRDITVAGGPRCAMTVRYLGKTDQELTFVGARCAAVRTQWVRPEALGPARLAALTPEVRRDLASAPNRRTLLITASPSPARTVAQLFPINAADIVYRVELHQ